MKFHWLFSKQKIQDETSLASFKTIN